MTSVGLGIAIGIFALRRPPLLLTTERLWRASARVPSSQVQGADTRRQLIDLIALVRFAIGLDSELKPFSEQVDKRCQEWSPGGHCKIPHLWAPKRPQAGPWKL